MIFGSNLLIEGKGFIHAYKTNGEGEVPGFPLRPDGFTFMNGANLGDVTGDGMLNIVALSYEQTFSPNDSIVLNVYDLDVPVSTANVQFGTYKGSNKRDGIVELTPLPDDAPGAATDFVVVPGELGALEATLTWNNPSEQVDGSPLMELTEVKVLRSGVEVLSIPNPVIGAQETFVDNTIETSGKYTYQVYGINSSGEGMKKFSSLYIGQDVPAAPENVNLQADLDDATLSWQAPQAGLNGAYFNGENLSYDIIRMPGEVVIAQDYTETQIQDNDLPLGNYYYIVKASNHIGEGGSASSDPALFAPEGVLMYETFDFAEELPEGFELVGAGHGWGISESNYAGGTAAPELTLSYSPGVTGDSWLKTYPVNVEGYKKLQLKLNQYLNNYVDDQGEVIGIDVSYDDGENWVVIWENQIGVESIDAHEADYYFSVPVGESSLIFGFRFQGNSYNINNWFIDDVYLGDASDIYEIKFNILENSAQETPVAGAKIVIEDKEYVADENGLVSAHLADGLDVVATISAEGYVDQQVNILVEGEDQNIIVNMMDDIIAPFEAGVLTENQQDGQALLFWNGYSQDFEFRHDDGTAVGQLGSQQGTINTVLGSVHRNDAVLSEMSWFITDEGGPHETIKIWVFGLNSNGMPDPSDILFQMENVANVDLEWNTYQFPEPVEAPNGFLLGVSYEGFAALGTDSGTDSEWPFENNTHFFAGDYSSGFSAIETLGDFSSNFMIRASGINNGSLPVKTSVAENNPMNENMLTSIKLDQAINTGNPGNSSKSFVGFNVYLDDMTTPVAEGFTDNTYLFTGLANGSYTAGVQSVYSTGVSEIVTVEFDVENSTVTVEDPELSAVSIFPNPAATNVNIYSPLAIQQLQVIDLLGEVVYDMAINASQYQLDISSLENGMYFVQVINSSGTTTQRLLISK